jgi:hypothetical protein
MPRQGYLPGLPRVLAREAQVVGQRRREAHVQFDDVLALCLDEANHLRQLRCLRHRFDCYRVERTSSRAGVAPAEAQRLSRRTIAPTIQELASDAVPSACFAGAPALCRGTYLA